MSSAKICPPGYNKRKSYTIKRTGKQVESHCVKKTNTKKNLGLNKVCPRGYLLRKPYVRSYQTSTKRTGYQVKRGNKTYRAYPKTNKTVVKATCIKDLAGPGQSSSIIGPLRKGDLSKYGYGAKKPEYERHVALNKAIQEYGALTTYRKLNAVAKLSVRRAPGISKIFEKDRNWIRSKHSLKAV